MTARVSNVNLLHRRTLSISAIATAVLIAFATLLIYQNLPSVSGMGNLVEASASLRNRPIHARLSGDFQYMEYRAIRSMVRKAQPGQMAVLRVTLAIENAASKHPTKEQNHVLGVSYLLLEDPENARLALESALKQEARSPDTLEAIKRSNDPDLLNDLAVAYQTLIEQRELHELRPFAVEAVHRAWGVRRSPQIAFTRALVLELLNVKESAIAAWEDCLAIDPSSRWSVEASERLKELRAPTEAELWPTERVKLAKMRGDPAAVYGAVNRYREAARLWCEDELLPQWGDAVLRGDSGAETLTTIVAIGQALRECNGERDVIDAADAIQRAPDGERLRLARGHAAYGRGRKAITAVEPANAMHEMGIALANLQPQSTPFSLRARIEHAAALYLTNDYRGVLNELAASPAKPRSNVSRGRSEWVLGITRVQMGAPELAIGHYRRAIEAFQRAGESDYECMMHSLLASTLENSGNYSDADVHRDRALQILKGTGNSDRRHIVVFEAAYAAIVRDTPALADALLDSVVAHDTATRSSFYACTSLMWRGAYRFRRGLREAAEDDLLQARQFCGAINDPQTRERATANLGLAHATLHPRQNTSTDLRDLDTSVEYFKKQKIARWLRTAYLARARALAVSGAPAAAERDFLAALREISSIRKQIDARDARVSFTATADDITDAYVEFLLQQHRERDAFEAADRSRLRELVDSPVARWNDDQGESVIARIQQLLPADIALIEYRVVGEKITVWVLQGTTLSTRTLSQPVAYVRALLQRLSAEVPEPEFRAACTDLYEVLLQPIAPLIRSANSLVIVPDDDLEHVPYAALYDTRGGQYLVETRATVVAPSAALFLQSVLRSRSRAVGEERMVVIEAGSAGQDVQALPEAAREAHTIAAMFPQARIARGNDALREASDATCLHFCGHTVHEVDGSIRALRLGEGAAGRIAPSQIAPLSLPDTRLVYLSACETDNGPVLRSEGGVTAARSFFAAGVPVVVATLWRVDDTAARQIARVFYERLWEGASPAEALRSAQLSLLVRRTNVRPDWAAFRVIGAGIGPGFTTAERKRGEHHVQEAEGHL